MWSPFITGFLIGVVLWFYWAMPILGLCITIIVLVGAVFGRFRLVAAFILGFVMGFI